jgi:hypothetical protein
MPIMEQKAEIALAPSYLIADGVSKNDPRPPAFQGCTDCKSPIHATGALIAYTRGTVYGGCKPCDPGKEIISP